MWGPNYETVQQTWVLWLEFEHACVCVMKGDRRKDCKGAVVQKDKRK